MGELTFRRERVWNGRSVSIPDDVRVSNIQIRKDPDGETFLCWIEKDSESIPPSP